MPYLPTSQLDDDWFIIPPLPPAPRLSTRLFFDDRGTPLQSGRIKNSHRPIPMLRAALVDAVAAESPQGLKRLLSARSSRFDPLVAWTRTMWENGTARPVRYAVRDERDCSAGGEPTDAMSSLFTNYWLHLSRSRRHGWPWNASQTAIRFFEEVEKRRPHFVCVNDDWSRRRATRSALPHRARSLLPSLHY